MKKLVLFWSFLLGSCIVLFAQTKVPFQLSLVYPIGTNGTNTDVINHTSINLFAGMATGLEGVEVGGFANVNKQNVKGMQVAGYLNVTGGESKGVALAGFSNIAQTAQGMQVAGFLNTAGTGTNKLCQFGGFGNVVSNLNGLQLAGFFNLGKTIRGFQGAGFLNAAINAHCTQMAGFTNIAADSATVQIAGFMNISNGDAVTQVASMLNVARKSKGTQLGFINIADSSNNQIGFVNISHNSNEQIAVWTDEVLTTSVAFKSGGRRFYGFLGLCIGADDNLRYGTTAGLGIRSYLSEKIHLDMELSSKFLFKDFEDKTDNCKDIKHWNSSSLKALLVIPIGSRVELFAGPSINYRFSNSAEGAKIPSNLSIWKDNNSTKTRLNEIYAGATGGIAVRIN